MAERTHSFGPDMTSEMKLIPLGSVLVAAFETQADTDSLEAYDYGSGGAGFQIIGRIAAPGLEEYYLSLSKTFNGLELTAHTTRGSALDDNRWREPDGFYLDRDTYQVRINRPQAIGAAYQDWFTDVEAIIRTTAPISIGRASPLKL